MRQFTAVVLSAFLLSTSVGCTALQSAGSSFRQTIGKFKPKTGDYWDPAEEADEGWVAEAGKEARGDRPLEKQNDWFRDMTMSPKAKSIERNLGFE